MTQTAFLRARRPEQKQQRREAILAAARDLARRSGVQNVTLSAVAEAVGLATSNVLRYFGTREAIYLVLLANEWQQFGDHLVPRLRGSRDSAEALTALVDAFVERPLFCDLLSHLPTSLELNASADAVRESKRAIHRHLGATGHALAVSTGLTTAEATELVAAAAGMAGLLYRAANPPPLLAELYEQDPDLAAIRAPMRATLLRLLTALEAGLPTLRTGPVA